MVFQICNLLNSRLKLNQEAQFPTSLMLKDQSRKKYQFKIFFKLKKIATKKQKSNLIGKKQKDDEIIKKNNFKNHLKWNKYQLKELRPNIKYKKIKGR